MKLFERRRVQAYAASVMLLVPPLVGLTATAANASPSTDGCPSGTLTMTWPDLQALGFINEAFFDAVDANGDGLVCVKPLSAQQVEKYCATHVCIVPIVFGFRDNTNGPER
jgi:hypothetical protein